MPKLSVFALVGFVTLVFSTAVSAQCPTFHTLTNGSAADAGQVMDNFNYILQCPNFTGNVNVSNGSVSTTLGANQLLSTGGPLYLNYSNTNNTILNGSGGSVGIGTTTPAAKLDVLGTGGGIVGRMGGTDNSAYSTTTYGGIDTLALFNSSTTAGTGAGISFLVKGAGPGAVASIAGISTAADYSTALVFQTRSSGGPDGERMRIDASGNVGIGTTTPAAKLDVNGSQNITSNSASALVVGPNGATNPALKIDDSVASAATGLVLSSKAAGNGVVLTATSSGPNEAVSISSKGTGALNLQIGGTTRIALAGTGVIFSRTNTGFTAPRFAYSDAADTGLTASTEAPEVYFNSGSAIRTHSTGALTIQRDFRITGSTHAFGAASTITDEAAFSVDGPTSAGSHATITNDHAIYIPAATITGTVTNSYGLTVNTASGATNNYAAEFLGGNVGIKTSSPAQALEVNGQVQVDTLASASSTSLCITATTNGVIATCSSSIRYKENVRDATFGLSQVMAMRPVTFKWRGRDEQDFGLIAEEVAKIDPRYVTYKAGKIEGVKYPQLTAVLAKAVQQEQAEITKLRSQNADQMAEIHRLRVEDQTEIGLVRAQLRVLQQRVGIRTARN